MFSKGIYIYIENETVLFQLRKIQKGVGERLGYINEKANDVDLGSTRPGCWWLTICPVPRDYRPVDKTRHVLLLVSSFISLSLSALTRFHPTGLREWETDRAWCDENTHCLVGFLLVLAHDTHIYPAWLARFLRGREEHTTMQRSEDPSTVDAITRFWLQIKNQLRRFSKNEYTWKQEIKKANKEKRINIYTNINIPFYFHRCVLFFFFSSHPSISCSNSFHYCSLLKSRFPRKLLGVLYWLKWRYLPSTTRTTWRAPIWQTTRPCGCFMRRGMPTSFFF